MQIPTLIIGLSLLVLCGGLSGCQAEEKAPEWTTAEAPAVPAAPQSPPADAVVVLTDYFSGAAKDALLRLKSEFELGLRQGMKKRSLAYAYEQHALRMRQDLLRREPFTQFYPYNGEFRLSDYPALLELLPFFTDKCGFQDGDKGEVFNYLCFNLNANFFAYLAALGAKNNFIKAFHDSYLKHKTIVSEMQQQLVLGAVEDLDFRNSDHQLFYFLLHAAMNEEHQAAERLSRNR